MILMPLASHAADHAGWRAMVQAPNDGDNALAAFVGPSLYADTWTRGIRSPSGATGASGDTVSFPAHGSIAGSSPEQRNLTNPRPASFTSPASSGDRSSTDHATKYRVTDAARNTSPQPSQLSSYLATSTALMAYGSLAVDGLHERLGEIRNVMPTSDKGGDVFVRYSGGEHNYVSRDRSRDFNQRSDTLQLGGALAFWNEEGSSSRFGLAADKGTVRIRSKDADDTQVTYRATGFSAWYTRQQDTGGYLDALLSSTRFSGKTETGPVLSGDIKADQWTASVEVGQPMMANDSVALEPQAQIKYQSLKISSITDPDGSIVEGGRSRQTTARVGVRIAKVDNERFVPYVRVDVSRVLGGGSSRFAVRSPDAGIAKTFRTERPGTSYGVSAGLTLKVNRVVDFYADAKMQGRISGHGQSGLSGSAGVRISF